METHMEVVEGFRERHPTQQHTTDKILKGILAFCVHSRQESFLLVDQIAGFYKTPNRIIAELSRSTMHEMVHLLGKIRDEVRTIAIVYLLDSYINPSHIKDLDDYSPFLGRYFTKDYYPHLYQQIIDVDEEDHSHKSKGGMKKNELP